MNEQEKRDLLVLLVERVLGGKRTYAHDGYRTSIYRYELPDGSEIELKFGTVLDGWDSTAHLADAWMLVNVFVEKFGGICVNTNDQVDWRWHCSIPAFRKEYYAGTRADYNVRAYAETAPLAISLAAKAWAEEAAR